MYPGHKAPFWWKASAQSKEGSEHFASSVFHFSVGVVMGSRHFVFEDEGAGIRVEDREAFDRLAPCCTWLYLAMGGVLSAAIGISGPLRSEAKETVALLHQAGIGKTMMLTGDSRNAAAAIAADDLRELVCLKQLFDRLMERIRRNYRFVMGFNSGLILLGALGILPPAASAMLHNTSTLLLSINCLTNLMDDRTGQEI